jgi:2-polyprenyl-6-methoxyphenol hydroxylase-like FAD-dependent oxidoreductase
MRGGVIQLHRWGLLDSIIDAGTPAIRQTTFRFANDQIVVPIKPGHGVDALYTPRRTVLDPLLVDAALAAGAEVRYGVTVTGLRVDLSGRITGIVGRDRASRPLAVDAGLVVGADGMRSAVAQHVTAPIEHHGAGANAVVYGYWSGVDTSGYEWIFRPDACAGIVPTNDGLACVFVAATPARIGRGGKQVLESVLAEACPETASRVAAATGPTGVRSFTGRPGFMRRAWGPGWALVGDAGYWKDPISAHGLTDALRDAELLARAVQASAAGDATEEDAFAAYQATRDRLSLALFRTSDTIAGQQWTDTDIGPLLLQLSAAMADEVDALAGFAAVPA